MFVNNDNYLKQIEYNKLNKIIKIYEHDYSVKKYEPKLKCIIKSIYEFAIENNILVNKENSLLNIPKYVCNDLSKLNGILDNKKIKDELISLSNLFELNINENLTEIMKTKKELKALPQKNDDNDGDEWDESIEDIISSISSEDYSDDNQDYNEIIIDTLFSMLEDPNLKIDITLKKITSIIDILDDETTIITPLIRKTLKYGMIEQATLLINTFYLPIKNYCDEINFIIQKTIKSISNETNSMEIIIPFIEGIYSPKESYFKEINLVISTLIQNHQIKTASLLFKLFFIENNLKDNTDTIKHSITDIIFYTINNSYDNYIEDEYGIYTDNIHVENLKFKWLPEISTFLGKSFNFTESKDLLIEKIISHDIKKTSSSDINHIRFHILINAAPLAENSLDWYILILNKLHEKLKNKTPNNFLNLFFYQAKELIKLISYQEPPEIILNLLFGFQNNDIRVALLKGIASDLIKSDKEHFKIMLSNLISCLVDGNTLEQAKELLIISVSDQEITTQNDITFFCAYTLIVNNLNNKYKIIEMTKFIKYLVSTKKNYLETLNYIIANILDTKSIETVTTIFKTFFIDSECKNTPPEKTIKFIKKTITDILFIFINRNTIQATQNNNTSIFYETAFNWLKEISLVLNKSKNESKVLIPYELYSEVILKIISEYLTNMTKCNDAIFFKTLSSWISIETQYERSGYELAIKAIKKEIIEITSDNKGDEVFFQKMVQFLKEMINHSTINSTLMFLDNFSDNDKNSLITKTSEELINYNVIYFKYWLTSCIFILLSNKEFDQVEKWLINSCKNKKPFIKQDIISYCINTIIFHNLDKVSMEKEDTGYNYSQNDLIKILIDVFILISNLKTPEEHLYIASFLIDFINSTLKNQDIFPINTLSNDRYNFYSGVCSDIMNKNFTKAIKTISTCNLTLKGFKRDESICIHLITLIIYFCENEKIDLMKEFLVVYLNHNK
jgi:hypothetical protein